MNLLKVLTLTFVISFVLGVGIIAFTPTAVQAGDAPLCNMSCGFKVSCSAHPSCGEGPWTIEGMYTKCYRLKGQSLNCTEPWTCGCVNLGCGICIETPPGP